MIKFLKHNCKALLILTGIILMVWLAITYLDWVLPWIILGIFFGVLTFHSKEGEEEVKLNRFVSGIAQMDIDNFPLPWVLVDEKENIVRYNQAFFTLFSDVYPGVPLIEVFAKKEEIHIGSQIWQTVAYQHELENMPYQSIFLMDITEIKSLKASYMPKDIAVSLVFIDNYEEVIEDIEDERKALLLAVIERRMSAFGRQLGGIVRKFEKDKFLLIFSDEKLAELKENKFEILKQFKEISVGKHLPVTISMGIGIGGENLFQSMEYARAAIDLALGRGGDQVLIKNGEQYEFFGGNTKEVANQGRVRARVKAYGLQELIAASDTIYVMGHANPDLDSLGSAFGVYVICKSMSKNCKIVLDKPSESVQVLYDRMKNEMDTDVFISKDAAKDNIKADTLLVIVDTHRPSIVECPELLTMSKKIVLFDHHRKGTEYIENVVLIYHEPYASSTSELVTEMIQYVSQSIRLTPLEAEALLAGITVDTKNFTVKTGARTFEAAAFLRRHGADTMMVRMLFRVDMDSYKMKVGAVANAEIYKESMAITYCEPHEENTSLAAALAADELLNISGIEASFVMSQAEDRVYISARSLGRTNVHRIMEKLGGGGHQTVSGAQLQGETIASAKEKIKNAIEEYIREEGQ